MARIKPISYQGPETEFIPTIGNSLTPPITTGATAPSNNTGYADLDYLIGLLDKLTERMRIIYNEAMARLQSFALLINDESLRTAHDLAYPEDTTPDAISYEEYRYLCLNNKSNAAQYVISSYENALRNPPGTNALDISNICFYIQNEITRIKEFVENYVGDLDDTSEYRTVELFQDWAEDTFEITTKLWQAVKGEISTGLPRAELDQLTSEASTQLQAVFQVKLNKINQNIRDLIARLTKNWEETSDFFYKRQLGPALKFQLNSARHVQNVIARNTMPVISSELAGTLTGIDSNFSVAISDQIKRNKTFSQTIREILINIVQRDQYFKYMSDLSLKGKSISGNFVNSQSVTSSDTILSGISDGILSSVSSNAATDTFTPSHKQLVDLEDPNAHPQYLLRSGGTIYGDITFNDGATIDGMVLSTHRHTGLDGSEKISGSDITDGTVTEVILDTTNATTSTPENLEVVSKTATLLPTGATKVVVRLGFDVETSSNIKSYEFEITKIQG